MEIVFLSIILLDTLNNGQHLTPKFNQFVADIMHKKITEGIWYFSNFENIKLEHPREYYI